MKQSTTILALLTLLGITSAAMATPVQWAENGHWYELVLSPNTSWTTANNLANSVSWQGNAGHLATLTSAAENNFVFSITGSGPYWLGAHQQANAIEPAGGWSWVTGEVWQYTNWLPGEPSNGNYGALGYENALGFLGRAGDNGRWNDAPEGWINYSNGGYVVEYESAPVPEPSTLLLLGAGLVGLGFARKRFAKK